MKDKVMLHLISFKFYICGLCKEQCNIFTTYSFKIIARTFRQSIQKKVRNAVVSIYIMF